MQQMQPGPYHAQPLIVPFQVFNVNRAIFLQPRLQQRAVDVVVVDPVFVAGVVGRIDVDALDFASILREECLQCVEVVSVEDEVIVGPSICGGGNSC